MRPPFLGIEVELGRARQQLEVFNEEVVTFLNSHPQSIETKLNPKGDGLFEVVALMHIERWPPPSLAILAGEVVFHLRSCLDHIVHELSIRHGAPKNELDSTEFPIFIDRARFSQLRTGGSQRGHPAPNSGLHKIRFVQPAAQAIIKGLQPYNARQNADLHPLWILQQLSNIYKHRRFHVVSNPIGRISLQQISGPFELVNEEVFMGRPLKNSTILFKALIRELPGFQRTVRVRQDIPPHVAFDETIPLPERYASEILEDIHSFVETQVLSPIKPFLA